jgi:hypothetical protein
MTQHNYTRICKNCMTANPSKAQLCIQCGQKMQPVEIFFSYAHKDKDLQKQLATHLITLGRAGVALSWSDRDILPGDQWIEDIDTHLQSADIILLLISPDFIASDYCYDIEMTKAMERHQRHQACVIPVIIRQADWQQAPFGILNALPYGAKPITSWPNRDQAWLDVVQGVKRVINARYKP